MKCDIKNSKIMEIEDYIQQKKILQKVILDYFEEHSDEKYHKLITFLEEKRFKENVNELRLLIRLFLKIEKNYHHQQDFSKLVEQLFVNIKENIKHSFSNYEIFKIFKNNKRILLFLLRNNVILFDDPNIQSILQKDHSQSLYFSPEIKNEKIDSKSFGDNRQLGENEEIICSIICKDSVEEFNSYIKQRSIPLTSLIKPSIFETNSFLAHKKSTLIEYASFFGSIQIIKYLQMNDIELTPSLWLYGIHSNNLEMIHFLEEKNVFPEDKTFKECFIESIKCHHNGIAHYIKDKLLDKKVFNDESVIKASIQYCNYEFFPTDFNQEIVFDYLCEYNYLHLVELLLKTEGNKNIQNNNVFFIFFLLCSFTFGSNEK